MPSKQAGRLEVAVAANLEQYDKDMKKVEVQAKRTGKAMSDSLSVDRGNLRSTRLLTVAIVGLAVAFRSKLATGASQAAIALSKIGVSGEGVVRLLNRLDKGSAALDTRLGDRLAASVTRVSAAMSKWSAAIRWRLAPQLAFLDEVGEKVAGRIGTAIAPAMQKLAPVFNKAALAGGKFAEILRKVGIVANVKFLVPLAKIGRVIGGQIAGAMDIAAFGAQKFGASLKNLGQRLINEGKLLGAFGHALNASGHAMEGVGNIVGKLVGVLDKLRIGIIGLTAVIVFLSLKAANEFHSSFARVRTILPENTKLVAEFGRGVRALSTELGVATDTLNLQLYQTLSAMPQFTNNAAAALKITAVGAKVAATGFAEAEDAIRAVTGILNAFGLEADQAIDVSDALFVAQDQGVTTFGEMAESIGRVSGLVAAMGGTYKELLAIIATNTPFVETGETISGLGAALASVLEQSPRVAKEAAEMGIQFNAAAIKAKGLIPFLREIAEVTEGDPDKIARLFGSREAIGLIANLSNNIETLNEKYARFGDTVGATDAKLEIMNNTIERQNERIAAAKAAIFVDLGAGLEGFSVRWRSLWAGMLESVDGFFQAFAASAAENDRDMEEFLANPLRKIKSTVDEVNVALGHAISQATGLRKIQTGEDRPTGTVPNEAQEALNKMIRAQRESQRQVNEAFRQEAINASLEPILRPGQPIFDIGFQRDQLESIRTAQERLAALRALAHGDADAFDADMARINDRMNEIILQQRDWLIENGIALHIANELLDLLVINYDRVDVAAAKAAKAAAKNAVEATSLMQALKQFGENFQSPAEVQALVAQYDALGSQLSKLEDDFDLGFDDLTEEQIDAINALRVALVGQRDELGEQIELYQRVKTAVEQFGEGIIAIAKDLPEGQLTAFSDAVNGLVPVYEAVAMAQAALAVAQNQFGDESEEAKLATKALEATQEKLADALRKAIAIMKEAGIEVGKLGEALALLDPKTPEVDEDKSFWGWIKNNADTIEGVARGLLSVGKSLGIISDEAAEALQGVIDLSEGLGRIAAGDLVGGITQSVGGIISIGSALFGESAASKERKKMMAENTRALRRLRESLDLQRQIVASIQGKKIDEVSGIIGDRDFTLPTPFSGADVINMILKIAEMEDHLKSLGLTWDDFAAMLEELGVTIDFINDENGKVNAQELQRAIEALNELDLADFFGGFEGELAQLRASFDLFDIDDSTKQLEGYYKLLREQTQLGLPEIDLSTPEGRAELERILQGVFEGIADGSLQLGDLGNLTPDQLLGLLTTAESLIDTIDDPADAQSFQQFRGITEITANRIQGTLTTIAFWSELSAQNIRELVRIQGGTPIGATGSDPAPNFDPSRFPGPDISDGPVEVIDQSMTVENLIVQLEAPEGADADQIAAAVVRKADSLLGEAYRREIRNSGTNKVRKVR